MLERPRTPGGCWVHYSQIDMQRRAFGEIAQAVEFFFEREWQDDFEWRAVRVRPTGTLPRLQSERPVQRASEAYSSAWTLWFDKQPRRRPPRRP